MALFSDVDWVIIAIVAAFLFLGPQGGPFVRQLGRWYGRMLQLKAELMSEVTSATAIADVAPRSTGSVGATLFGLDEPTETAPGPVSLPGHPGMITHVQPVTFWSVETQTLGAGLGAGAWWATTSNTPGEVVRLR